MVINELQLQNWDLLAKASVRDGEQRYTEEQIRSLVGAPSIEESNTCACGENINECDDAYSHITHGV